MQEHAVERPAELIEREYATRLYARLNSTMPADDWAELLSSFGASAESIEADIAALEAGTFHSGDVVDFNWDRTGGMFFAFTVAIGKQKVGDRAIRVGDTIPDFTALDEFGQTFDSSALAGHPVLIKFFRAHW